MKLRTRDASSRGGVMNSRSGDRVPSGDGAGVDRGGAGEHVPATGSARIVIGMAALLLTLLCVGLAFAFGLSNGLLLLATIFGGVYAWAAGAFARDGKFWSR